MSCSMCGFTANRNVWHLFNHSVCECDRKPLWIFLTGLIVCADSLPDRQVSAVLLYWEQQHLKTHSHLTPSPVLLTEGLASEWMNEWMNQHALLNLLCVTAVEKSEHTNAFRAFLTTRACFTNAHKGIQRRRLLT